MRSLYFIIVNIKLLLVNVAKYGKANQVEEGNLGRICSMHGKEKRAFVINSEGMKSFGRLCVNGSLMLKLILNEVENMVEFIWLSMWTSDGRP
jgi:hypothetical protein